MVRRSKFTIEINKKYKLKDKSLEALTKFFRLKKSDIKKVYERGVGAYYNNPSSVRSNVDNSIQWAMARVYKFILNVIKYRKKEFNSIPKSAGSDYKYVKSSGDLNNYIPPPNR